MEVREDSIHDEKQYNRGLLYLQSFLIIGIFTSVGFLDKLKNKWNEGKFVCVGLDSDFSKIPPSFKASKAIKPIEQIIFEFNKSIIDSTFHTVCAYKINSAFYEAEGANGWKALEETTSYLKQNYPDIPIILDTKRADIGNTNQAYAKAFFDNLGVDAITVNPYLGKEAIEPFLSYKDKGIIIVVKTSNPGSGEFQDLNVDGKPLYQIVAEHVANDWNENGNCAVVVGATHPQELKKIREIVGDMPILVPGIGTQGGNLEEVLKNGLNSNKQGLIISSSSSIIYSPNPKEATLELTNQIKLLYEHI